MKKRLYIGVVVRKNLAMYVRLLTALSEEEAIGTLIKSCGEKDIANITVYKLKLYDVLKILRELCLTDNELNYIKVEETDK